MQQSFETPTSHFFQSSLSFLFPHISNSGESCLVNYMHIERMTCIQMVMHSYAKVGHRKNLGDWWGLAEVQFQQWINVALRIFFFFFSSFSNIKVESLKTTLIRGYFCKLPIMSFLSQMPILIVPCCISSPLSTNLLNCQWEIDLLELCQLLRT